MAANDEEDYDAETLACLALARLYDDPENDCFNCGWDWRLEHERAVELPDQPNRGPIDGPRALGANAKGTSADDGERPRVVGEGMVQGRAKSEGDGELLRRESERRTPPSASRGD